MRNSLLIVWLMLPVAALAYHYGPGLERVRMDDAAGLLAQAERHAAAGEWAEASRKYDEALLLLPTDRVRAGQRVRLERAKAQMLAQKLPEAHKDLQGLVAELQADAGADPALLDEARAALANAQYYMTWLLRLEGQPRELWEPEIEAARQNYRLLAERAEAAGDEPTIAKRREDLEAAVRLARLDLRDLQGLPLPSQ